MKRVPHCPYPSEKLGAPPASPASATTGSEDASSTVVVLRDRLCGRLERHHLRRRRVELLSVHQPEELVELRRRRDGRLLAEPAVLRRLRAGHGHALHGLEVLVVVHLLEELQEVERHLLRPLFVLPR
jgi:hypothetical protein